MMTNLSVKQVRVWTGLLSTFMSMKIYNYKYSECAIYLTCNEHYIHFVGPRMILNSWAAGTTRHPTNSA